MAANSYDINDVVRITGTFRSTANVLSNPTKVTITYGTPAGVVTVLTSTMAAVIHPSSGVYYTDVLIAEEGVYEYRVHSTGLIRSSTQGWWRVRTQRAST